MQSKKQKQRQKNQAKLGQNSRTPNAETSPNITNQQVSSSRAKYRARKEERDPAMAAERADRHLECGLERLIHCNKTKRVSANKNNLGEKKCSTFPSLLIIINIIIIICFSSNTRIERGENTHAAPSARRTAWWPPPKRPPLLPAAGDGGGEGRGRRARSNGEKAGVFARLFHTHPFSSPLLSSSSVGRIDLLASCCCCGVLRGRALVSRVCGPWRSGRRWWDRGLGEGWCWFIKAENLR